MLTLCPRGERSGLFQGARRLADDETQRMVNLHRNIVRDPARFLKIGARLLIDTDGPVRIAIETVFNTSVIIELRYRNFIPARVVEDRVEWAEPPEGRIAAYEYRVPRLHLH